MAFVSYSQNFEDVMLMRALSGVQRGYYIDVGAAEPFADSVTAAFYKQGWRGINVEPMNEPFMRLAEARPEDVNLQVALEEEQGVARYYSIDGGNGISTGDAIFGEKYKKSNWNIELVPVVVSTLKDICEKYVGDRPIHFLKIDVEGKERAVLLGGDFDVYRPWIVVIEATQPNTQVPSHQEWENLIESYNYSFVYFDGLNRFYVSNEKLETLKPAFAVPPNWFDHFVKISELEATRSAAEAKQAAASLKEKAYELESAIGLVEKSRDEAISGWRLEKAAREDLERRINELLSENGRTENSDPPAVVDSPEKRGESADIKSVLKSTTPELTMIQRELEEVRRHLEEKAQQVEILEAQKLVVDEELREALNSRDALSAEVDAYYQEAFESSRHIAWLTQERMHLRATAENRQELREIGALRDSLQHERDARAKEIQAVHRSTSWRVTAPLRGVRRMFNAKN
jgi:FkbM family methyltransferase